MREGESPLEARLRNLRQETQKLNQDWWTEHNREFKQGRENFIKNILETKYPNEPDKSTLSADEMSEFYRFGMRNNINDLETEMGMELPNYLHLH